MSRLPSPCRGVGFAVLLVIALAFGSSPADAQVDPRADEILRAMGDYLAAADSFSFEAEVVSDTFSGLGQEIQFGANVLVSVRRPDGFRVEYDGDERRHRVVFDGSTVTLHDLATNLYAVTETPSEIGAAIDHMFDTYDILVPIADFVFPNAYDVLIENVDSGGVVGRHAVDGVPCHHLAFIQETLDWQIWIEDSAQPLPRKLVITYKNEPGAPHYGARFVGWDLVAPMSDHYFEFRPPRGATQVEFMAPPRVGLPDEEESR